MAHILKLKNKQLAKSTRAIKPRLKISKRKASMRKGSAVGTAFSGPMHFQARLKLRAQAPKV